MKSFQEFAQVDESKIPPEISRIQSMVDAAIKAYNAKQMEAYNHLLQAISSHSESIQMSKHVEAAKKVMK